MFEDNTGRFSDRVHDYKKYRPGYPAAVVEHLFEVGFLGPDFVVADVGAGTGIFTRRLLETDLRVVAVEPNDEMAAALRQDLGDRAGLDIVVAPAEATSLPDGSVDLVTVAQALHWFDPSRTRPEFLRITRPPHRMMAVWNRRDTTSSAFLRDYESLLYEFGVDYAAIVQRWDSEQSMLGAFYGHEDYGEFATSHVQTHDWQGLVGRLMSSSYGPKEDHANHAPMVAGLRDLFQRHAIDDCVRVVYETRVYTGQLAR